MFKGMLGSYILIRTVIMASMYFMLTRTSIFNTIKTRSEVIYVSLLSFAALGFMECILRFIYCRSFMLI